MRSEGTAESDDFFFFEATNLLAWLMLTGSGFDSSWVSQTGLPRHSSHTLFKHINNSSISKAFTNIYKQATTLLTFQYIDF